MKDYAAGSGRRETRLLPGGGWAKERFFRGRVGFVSDVSRGAAAGKGSAMVAGDQVVFARLDVAEALGIWRHARGRIVGTHAEAPRGRAIGERLTVDVKFEGHDTLERYLPELFEPAH